MGRERDVAIARAPTDGSRRAVLTAEILSIGSEITTGETRDTNASELARSLAMAGVEVRRLQAVPDTLDTVRTAFADALGRADLVVSSGGLGPTPDDLTREAIAAVLGETPQVTPDLESWLRGLWARRDMPFPEMNLKQAWLIPSASALPNPNGTAPGWWVEAPPYGIIVALPGPPREMRPMWQDQVLPRLVERGLGAETVVRTLRLTGIGESQAADVLGEDLLRADNPRVATYARADAVDVRISARGEQPGSDRPAVRAADLADVAEARVVALLGEHVWARGATTWAEAIEAELGRLDWTLAVAEVATGGALATLLGGRPWLRYAESLAADAPGVRAPSRGDAGNGTRAAGDVAEPGAGAPGDAGLEALAARARTFGGATLGVAVRARPQGEDTAVSVTIVDPSGTHRQRRLVFLGGEHGRTRSALTAASVILDRCRSATEAKGA